MTSGRTKKLTTRGDSSALNSSRGLMTQYAPEGLGGAVSSMKARMDSGEGR